MTTHMHNFEPSWTGMVCEKMVMRDGGGDACGLPPEHSIHTPVCNRAIGDFICVSRHRDNRHRMVHKSKAEYYTEIDGVLTSNLPNDYPVPPVNLYGTPDPCRLPNSVHVSIAGMLGLALILSSTTLVSFSAYLLLRRYGA